MLTSRLHGPLKRRSEGGPVRSGSTPARTAIAVAVDGSDPVVLATISASPGFSSDKFRAGIRSSI